MKYTDLESDKPLYIKPIKKAHKKIISDEVASSKIIPRTKSYVEDAEIVNKPVNIIPNVSKSGLLPQIDFSPKGETEQIDWLPMYRKCGSSHFYSDASKEGYFLKDNLFSELVSDYQRSEARLNLGIGEEYSLIWANIKGDVVKNKELYDFIMKVIEDSYDAGNMDYSELYETFVKEVNYRLLNKVNSYNGKLYGEPTTTLSKMSDNSGRIASTEWVNARIQTNESNILNWLELDRDYMFIGDDPKNIVVTWEFYVNPEELYIDNKKVSVDSKVYTINGVDDNYIIKFSYKANDKWYNKFLSFNKVLPIYVGKSSKDADMVKIKNSPITVHLEPEEYVYLYLPNEEARISVDNIYGGFIQVGDKILNNLRYYLYKSVNSGLGTLHINYDE